MIFRSGRFRKPLTVISVLSFVAICHGEPDAEAILRAARLNPVGQKISLEAQLRTGSLTTPFEIIVDEAIRYHFQNPEQELILELREDSSSLSERVGGKTAPVKPARYDDAVRGTGITYEDLFLRFLYWKKPKLLGEDKIRSRKAWKIELQAWGTSSQYGVARLWIDQESGALLRIEGYNREGKLLRRFEVISAQKIDGQWMLKQMRVETLDPESSRILNRTYLEVLGKSAVAS
jgi:Outer membrane lipoprotein-sorting protein